MGAIPLWGRLGLVALLCVAFISLVAAKPSASPTSPVVKVMTENGHGTGVSIGNSIILTADHVVGDEKTVKLKTEAGNIIEGEVLWTSEKYDIAYVRAKGTEGIGSARLSCREPRLGEEITIRGNPSNQEFITVWGRVAGPAREVYRWASVTVANMAIIPGQSGGPVMDDDGNVVGIVVGVMGSQVGFGVSLVGVGYFVPGDVICGLLARA